MQADGIRLGRVQCGTITIGALCCHWRWPAPRCSLQHYYMVLDSPFQKPHTTKSSTVFDCMESSTPELRDMPERLSLSVKLVHAPSPEPFPFLNLPPEIQKLVLEAYFDKWTAELTDYRLADEWPLTISAPMPIKPVKVHITGNAPSSAILQVSRDLYNEAKPMLWRSFDQVLSLRNIMRSKSFVKGIGRLSSFKQLFKQTKTIAVHFGQFPILHDAFHKTVHDVKDLFPQLDTIDVGRLSWRGMRSAPNAVLTSYLTLLLEDEHNTTQTASMCLCLLEQRLSINLHASETPTSCLMHGVTLKADLTFNAWQDWKVFPRHALPGDEVIISFGVEVASERQALTTRITKKRFQTSVSLASDPKNLELLRRGDPLPESVKIDESNNLVFEDIAKEWLT